MVSVPEQIQRLVPINIEDYPRCAVCNMPVEKFYLVDCCNSVKLVVECHKSIETVTLEGQQILFIDLQSIMLDRAFDEEATTYE